MKQFIFKMAQRLVIDPVVRPSLNVIRSELDLKPVKHVMKWWHSRSRLLCLFPEWFCAPQLDWPAPLSQVDFPLWDERDSDQTTFPIEIQDKLETFLCKGSPPVAFTPGSANIFGNAFFQTALESCQKINCRAIFLTRFDEQIPKSLPESAIHIPFAPLSLLLPRCAALVHHGGIGSAAQAMAAGIPQLIRPQAHDQFDNASRIAELGIGRFLKPNRFTTRNVSIALAELLHSQTILAQCKSIATKIDRKRGIAQAIDNVESIDFA